MDSELKQEFGKIHEEFGRMNARFDNFEGKLEEMGEALQLHIINTEQNFKQIKENMVTKDYLAGSLAAFKQDHGLHVRDQDDQEYKS